ncbi:hypothetical protein ALC62_01273, partial [Cyphomyrmex costatus]
DICRRAISLKFPSIRIFIHSGRQFAHWMRCVIRVETDRTIPLAQLPVDWRISRK